MKQTGEILKKAREEKGLSLNEVALSLKISSKVLKSIEDGDEKNLPAKTFLRGFVKSYATFLRLDSDKVLEVFYSEFGSTKPQPYIRPSKDSHEENSQTEGSSEESTAESKAASNVTTLRPSTSASPTTPPPKAEPYNPLNEKKNTKTIAIFVVVAVLVGLIIFTKKMIDKYTKEAEVPTAQVEKTMEGATPVSPEAPMEAMNPEATPAPSPINNLPGATTKAAPVNGPIPTTMAPTTPAPTTPTQTSAQTPAKTLGHTVAPAPTTPPTTTTVAPAPAPTTTPAGNATTAPATTAPSQPVATPTPAATPTAKPEEKSKPVELIVEALDAVEIEYSAPNGKPQKIKLSAEQVHTFKSRSGLRINFSNGGAVNLILNGKEVGIPGDLGKPIKLSY